ncbi:hypothetical protein HKL94_02440 [Candidatus Parcubacteria bacterium]|nr:hypothetical protein [Candidatus Parcubacteria bacterium]
MSKKGHSLSFERTPQFGDNSAERVFHITEPANIGDALEAWTDERTSKLLEEQEAARERRRVERAQESSEVRERKEVSEGIKTTSTEEASVPLAPGELKEKRRREIEKELKDEWEAKNGPMEKPMTEAEIGGAKLWGIISGRTWDGGTTRMTDAAGEFLFDHENMGRNSVSSRAERLLIERFPEYAEKPTEVVETTTEALPKTESQLEETQIEASQVAEKAEEDTTATTGEPIFEGTVEVKERTPGETSTIPPDAEGTPLEWRAKLRGLIEGAKGTFNRYTSSKEELIRRSNELDIQAERIGKIEEVFRSLGERYNKYGWKTKLAVGVSLGVGAAAFSTVSLPAAIACMSGIAAQRIAGMATMYLKFEKGASHNGKNEERFLQWGSKEKAMMKAILYTVLMGVAVKEGVELASQSSWGDAVHEWLRSHYPFGHTEAPPAQHQVRAAVVRPEMHKPAVTIETSTPEMPSIAATPGHGYEYMTKRLWEQLQKEHLDPSRYPRGSDIRRLLEANAGSIDKVVHQIAADPQHGFFHPDGTSVLIEPSAHMTINAAGQIHMSDSINAVRAPEGMPVTPAYHPTEAPVHTEEPPVHEPTTTLPSQAHTTPILLGAPTHSHLAEIPLTPHNSPIAGGVPTVGHEIITNRFDLQIPVSEAHIYTDPSAAHLFVYGGSPETQADAIQKYLTLHPHSVVYGADNTHTYRIPFYLLGGKVTAGPPVQTRGFLGFFQSWVKAPGPNNLKKLIQ